MTPRELAERSLLGVILQRPAAILLVREWLRPADFEDPDHRVVYEHVRRVVARAESAGQAAELEKPIEMHTLAPPPVRIDQGRADVYGLIVLEASIRSRAEQLSRDGHHLSTMIAPAGAIAAFADHVLRECRRLRLRWSTAIDRSPPQGLWSGLNGPVPAVDPDAGGDPEPYVLPAVQYPERAVPVAERAILGHVLLDADVLGNLVARLLPSDFGNAAVGMAYAAAVELHQRGEPVDATTLAWRQRRHGGGLSVEELAGASQAVAGSVEVDLDVVQRAALARTVGAAAQQVEAGARDFALMPEELLAATRDAYEQLRGMTRRMSGSDVLAGGLGGDLLGAGQPESDQQAGPGRDSGHAAVRGIYPVPIRQPGSAAPGRHHE